MKVHQLRKFELIPLDNPSAKISAIGRWTINIHGQSPDGKPIDLRISSDELPPQKPFKPRFKPIQYQALWLVTECSVFPEKYGIPGWHLAEKLEIEHSNLSRDVISPLKKMNLISHETRPTTKPKSSHPNKLEKVYYLKRQTLRNAFNILSDHFYERYYGYMQWTGEEIEEISWMNYIADCRFYALALLQKKLDEYENSAQYFIDMDVPVPPNISSKRDDEKLMPGEMRFEIRGIGPLRHIHGELDN